jgi:hypothetical protein
MSTNARKVPIHSNHHLQAYEIARASFESLQPQCTRCNKACVNAETHQGLPRAPKRPASGCQRITTRRQCDAMECHHFWTRGDHMGGRDIQAHNGVLRRLPTEGSDRQIRVKHISSQRYENL